MLTFTTDPITPVVNGVKEQLIATFMSALEKGFQAGLNSQQTVQVAVYLSCLGFFQAKPFPIVLNGNGIDERHVSRKTVEILFGEQRENFLGSFRSLFEKYQASIDYHPNRTINVAVSVSGDNGFACSESKLALQKFNLPRKTI